MEVTELSQDIVSSQESFSRDLLSRVKNTFVQSTQKNEKELLENSSLFDSEEMEQSYREFLLRFSPEKKLQRFEKEIAEIKASIDTKKQQEKPAFKKESETAKINPCAPNVTKDVKKKIYQRHGMNLRFTTDRYRLEVARTDREVDKLKSKMASSSTSTIRTSKGKKTNLRTIQKSAVTYAQTKRTNDYKRNSQNVSTQSPLFESEDMEHSFREYLNKSDPPPSPMPTNISKNEQLQWLRQHRNVGLWVMCDECKKYRYLKDTVDPLDLPDTWYCPMNPDHTRNSCSYEEETISLSQQMELIENKYNAGSVVFAKVVGYPWWPAMVQDDPKYMTYFILEDLSDIPLYYHVRFFLDGLTAWVHVSKLKGFAHFKKVNKLKPSHVKQYGLQLKSAKREAKAALKMTLIKRLEQFAIEP